MTPTKMQAIQKALNGEWQQAVDINEQILQGEPDDIDALNRLGFAQASLGDLRKAKNAYQKVLALDAQNPIALKNLKKLTGIDGKTIASLYSSSPMNNIFIEEPGKTKVVDLVNTADQKAVNKLRCGEFLSLQVKRMKIFVLDKDKGYIGMLPDDLSIRLIKFINGGNQYEAFVQTVNTHRVAIFIKESKRTGRFKNQPSFIMSDKTKLILENSTLKRAAKDQSGKNTASDDDESSDKDYADGGMEESF